MIYYIFPAIMANVFDTNSVFFFFFWLNAYSARIFDYRHFSFMIFHMTDIFIIISIIPSTKEVVFVVALIS